MFDALVSFSYNLGLGNLDKSTLLKKVNANPSDATIRLEFMKWVNKGSSFEKGLTRRRKAEADLYFTTTSSTT
jgi:lysozyme